MTVSPGQVGFAHNTGIMAKLIRLGSWLRLRKGKWNHMFVISDEMDSDGEPLIIQATLKGVTGNARLDQVSPKGTYVVLTPPENVRSADVLAFAKAQIGMEYGLLTILAIVLDVVSFSWFPAFRGARKPSWICSALGGESLRYGGWLHEWEDLYDVFPQQVYDALIRDGFSVVLEA